MCHDADSRPPITDAPLTSAEGTDLVLTTADGVNFRTFQARPAQPSDVGIVVLPDVRGLHDYYRDLALRLAEQGHEALAVDYYGRTAGPEARPSGIGFEDMGFDFMAHVHQLTKTGLEADFATAVSHLRSTTACTSVFTIGFCMGGRNSYLSPTRGQNLNGCIGFYGSLGELNGIPGPLQVVDEINTPLLLLQSADDTDPDRFPNAEFSAALTARGVEHDLVIYEAPHSFFDVKMAAHADVCLDAWSRIKGFIARYS